MEFAGLQPAHLDAYEPTRWSSNVHNMARMRAKDALQPLAQAVEAKLADSLRGITRGSSDETPTLANNKKVDSQWFYWIRDEATRQDLTMFLEKIQLTASALLHLAEHDKHAALAFVLRYQECWVGLHLGASAVVDRTNLAAKLRKDWERDGLHPLLAALPGSLVAGSFDGGFAPAPQGDAAWAALADPLSAPEMSWSLGWSLPRQEVIAMGADLCGWVGARLEALLPIFSFVLWSRQNDHIEATKHIQEERAQQRKQAAAFSVGERVRIMTGLFTGKVGTVLSLETKAQVKVKVGNMSVVISGADLRSA